MPEIKATKAAVAIQFLKNGPPTQNMAYAALRLDIIRERSIRDICNKARNMIPRENKTSFVLISNTGH